MSSNDAPAVERILVGVASTNESRAEQLSLCPADRNTFEQALRLARKAGAEMRLLHVIDFLDQRHIEGGDDVVEHVRAELGPQLAALEAQAAEAGVRCAHKLVWGKPWYELLRAATEWPADVVAVSPRREKLSIGDRLLHGSTTNRLLRKAPCALWVVDPRDSSGAARILALVDHSEVSARVIAATDALARAFGARRYALHCLDYPDDIVLHRVPDAQRAIRQYHQQVRAKALTDLETLTGGARGGYQLMVDAEWVVRRVPFIVDEQVIDLVVLGSLSHASLAGRLLGTTAERILERCYVSTWVVRPEGWRGPIQFGD